MEWIKATLEKLEKQLPPGKNSKSKRIFVLSIMGVQSSGKSTLLNIMFGIQMKTSVGQCTRGVNMQLIPVEGRAEYDYILLLDTEGTRAPEYHGMQGSEKRDNQMATLSILLADATIIVNPGENDAAIKEILPIVLLAYQGSQLAEKNGGRLSSMVFFVYNRIDTQQKDKLGNIIQILGTSLHEGFYKVSKLSGMTQQEDRNSENKQMDKESAGLFRRFKLDASNSNESDVRILGNLKENFAAPKDVPDPAYGQALCEFREHIHSRVTGRDPTSFQQWKSRSLTDIFEYLDLVWLCIRSADFTLTFKTVMERAAFDQLNIEYKKFEKELIDTFYNSYTKIEKEILAKKQQTDHQNIDTLLFQDFEIQLLNLVREKERESDTQVSEALDQSGRSKWKTQFESQWQTFKSGEKQRWIDRLRTFFGCQLKYDSTVNDIKKEMRLKIRDMFANEEAKNWNLSKKQQKFNQLFDAVVIEAEDKYPPMNVQDCIQKVYVKNIRIASLPIKLNDKKTVDQVKKEMGEICSGKGWKEWGKETKLGGFLYKNYLKYKNSGQPTTKEKLREALVSSIENCTKHAQVYMDSLVDKVIDDTIEITNKNDCRNQQSEVQYAHIFAKALVTKLLEKKQRDWESVNSVSAKIAQPTTRQEMQVYFNLVSQGIVGTQLLVSRLDVNLQNILHEGFKKELIRTVDLRVRTKTWLSDPKALQARLDLALLHLMDDGNKVSVMLENIRKSAEFYEQVMIDLIQEEIPDLKKEWEQFDATLKSAVKSAVIAASSVKSGRAKKFIDEIHSQCLGVFNDNYLAMNLIKDSDGCEGCDHEEENVFKEKCLQLVEGSTNVLQFWSSIWKFWDRHWKMDVSKQVLQHMRSVRGDDVARPRCKIACPRCNSLCIHPANHDTTIKKHDTFHQPGGLAGAHWTEEHPKEIFRLTLCHQTCSEHFVENNKFIIWNGDKKESHFYRDFAKVYSDWMEPKLDERLPLREYIFAKYQEELAHKYEVKECIEIPSAYSNHDLETIRLNLERAANLSQDKNY